MVWRNTYQPKEGIMVTHLEQAVLSNGKQIQGNEGLDVSRGELITLSYAEKSMVREQIQKQGFKVGKRARYTQFGFVVVIILLVLFVLQFVGGAASFLFLYSKFGVSINNTSGMKVLKFLLLYGLFLAAGIVAYMVYRKFKKKYQDAVQNGNLMVYQFPIEQKVIYDKGDYELEDEYYIVVGGAYVDVGRNQYLELHIGDMVRVALIDYDGKVYFAMVGD